MNALRIAALWAVDVRSVGSGRIQGGWEYIWAAYGVTWALLLLYGGSLWFRRPRGDSKGHS